jgi:hypothetical protein
MELNQKILAILQDSDIVWPRYGSDTLVKLTERILRAVEKDREEEAD